MTWRERLSALPAWLTLGLPAAVLILGVIVVFGLSVTGRAASGFVDAAPGDLAAADDINLSVSFDEATYHQGDLLRYRMRVIWRARAVTPDLESFANSISFYPFDNRGHTAAERRLGGGVREYIAEYVLQPINVATAASYQLDTATVYYTRASEEHTEVHALRANPAPVYLGEFYPYDISSVSPRPPKPRLDDARSLRRSLMTLFGSVLLLMTLFLVWQRGRQRPYAELSPAEQLWRDLDELRREPNKDRQYVVDCERHFTQVLELISGITPTEFWSEQASAPGEWHDLIVDARALFGAAYRPAAPKAADVMRIAALIESMLAPMVEGDRLRREVHVSLIDRLRRQPAVLLGVGVLAAAAVSALLLAAMPSAWTAKDIGDYNAAVALLEADDFPAALDGFLALGELAKDPRVKAAALYNTGTLLVDPRQSRFSRSQYENFLRTIFVADITLSRMLHDMELDAEFELLTLLTELTRQYVQAESVLKAAVRVDPFDMDARRNLELVAKVRLGIARSLAHLISEGEQNGGGQQMLNQTIIDLKLLMEAELPDDFAKQDEGKDDREYFILERF
jgi:hypothetical protein